MDYYTFILIIIIMTLMIIFYGGKNTVNMIEYNSNYFENYKNIMLVEKTLQKYNSKFNDITKNESDYITIDEIDNISHIILPNYINNYLIKIKPYSYFDIKKIIDIAKINNLIMIVFNYNNIENLELLVNKDNNNGHFYNLTNKISITGIYDIYNNNDKEIYITVFIVKKPFWYW